MAIKNYTTQIASEKTVAEIEKLLTEHNAKRILKEYDAAGHIESVSFMSETGAGLMAFKLPMNREAMRTLINQAVDEGKLAKRFRDDLEQGERVGWRIMRDWIDAQMAMIDIQMVKIEQIFLPYAVNEEGKTLYESFAERKFKGLIEAPKEEA